MKSLISVDIVRCFLCYVIYIYMYIFKTLKKSDDRIRNQKRRDPQRYGWPGVVSLVSACPKGSKIESVVTEIDRTEGGQRGLTAG